MRNNTRLKLIRKTDEFIYVGSEKIDKALWKKYYTNEKEVYEREFDFRFVRHEIGRYKENGKVKVKYKDFWVNTKTNITYQTFQGLLKGLKINNCSNNIVDMIRLGDRVEYLNDTRVYDVVSQYQISYIKEHGFRTIYKKDNLRQQYRKAITYDKEIGVSCI